MHALANAFCWVCIICLSKVTTIGRYGQKIGRNNYYSLIKYVYAVPPVCRTGFVELFALARVYIKGKHPKFAVLILHKKALI